MATAGRSSCGSLVLVCFYLFSTSPTIISSQLESCTSDTPIQGCTCTGDTMICRGKNDVTYFPTFNNSDGMRYIIFNGCSLGNVTKKLPYKNMVSLTLNDCELTSISFDVFAATTELQSLSIRNNTSLATLPVFSAGNKIKEFACDSCGLSTVPTGTLANLVNLQSLSLSGNYFSKIEGGSVFPALASLRRLNLTGCGLVDIGSEAFLNLTVLTELYLSNNELPYIREGTFKSFENSLKVLHLANNNFTGIFEGTAIWRNLTHLTLGENKWDCDCSIIWMSVLKELNTDNVTCSSPPSLLGMSVFDVEGVISCSLTRRNVVVLGFAIPIILICVVLIGYYARQIIRSRRRDTHERQSFKYRSVYGETVESNSSRATFS